MSITQIILTTLLTILIVGFLSLSIVVISMVVVYIKDMNSAVSSALNNNFHCGEKYCLSKPVDLPLPEKIPQRYDNTFARYCADLVVRIEAPVDYSGAKVVIPKDTKIILKIYEDGVDLMLGMVLLDSNNNVWIVYRGTSDIKEWQDDFTYNQSGLPGKKTVYQIDVDFLSSKKSVKDTPAPRVHAGFINIYKQFREKLLDVLKTTNHKNIIVTGHSLGAAMTAITTVDLYNQGYNPVSYKFASPRVGDKAFCDLTDKSTLYHIYNTCDIIPTLPFSVSPNLSITDKPYFYQHCGEGHSFTNNWLSSVNNHIMTVHIHYLDTQIKQGK